MALECTTKKVWFLLVIIFKILHVHELCLQKQHLLCLADTFSVGKSKLLRYLSDYRPTLQTSKLLLVFHFNY